MSDQLAPLPAIACAPMAIPASERSSHFALGQALLSKRALSKQLLDDGYIFTFASKDFGDVARFVGNERLCCPFMAFSLEIPHSGGPLSLCMSGPPGLAKSLMLSSESLTDAVANEHGQRECEGCLQLPERAEVCGMDCGGECHRLTRYMRRVLPSSDDPYSVWYRRCLDWATRGAGSV